MTFCYQISDQIQPPKCLPGSIAFSPNQSPLNPQNPQNQPKSLNIEASRTVDHIAKGFENENAIYDESGRGRRGDGRNFIVREGLRVIVEGEALIYLP